MTNIALIGGSGFLGTAISKRIVDDPQFDRVVIFSRDWHKQNALKESLGNPAKFRWFIGDILDKDRLVRALNGVDVVIHCAALKDAITGYYNPREVMTNNILGTQNVIDAAIDAEVNKVLFISSDKACAPESGYGASKSMGEHLIVSGNGYSPNKTRFANCRYGNVWASSGSAIPLFQRQKETGVLTVTSEKMTRYWFLPELAVSFVLECLDKMQGGEIFVPKLPASTIVDLAKAIAPDAEIKIIGTRPSEKLAETMISPTESYRTTDIGWSYRIEPGFKFWDSTPYSPPGSPVPQGWSYSSASATRLSVEQLRQML